MGRSELVLGYRRQQVVGNPVGFCGFKRASLPAGTSLDTHGLFLPADPIGHLGAVVRLQGIERPIAAGHHVNSTLWVDQNGYVRGFVA